MAHHQTFLHYAPIHHHPQQLNIPHVSQTDSQSNQIIPSSSNPPGAAIVAKGDWTKDLVHLAKTAELKKHALTLQLHTAHILSAHASLEQKSKAIQDIMEQRNRLDSERSRLITTLREVNEDRDQVELMESQLQKECSDTRAKIDQLTNGDYAIAKADVDRLRAELGQPPMPSLQETLDERRSQYLTERRLNGNGNAPQLSGSSSSSTTAAAAVAATTTTTTSTTTVAGKRPVSSSGTAVDQDSTQVSKRPRGRPKGSKNKAKSDGTSAATA